jgi:hypothetical protein
VLQNKQVSWNCITAIVAKTMLVYGGNG